MDADVQVHLIISKVFRFFLTITMNFVRFLRYRGKPRFNFFLTKGEAVTQLKLLQCKLFTKITCFIHLRESRSRNPGLTAAMACNLQQGNG